MGGRVGLKGTDGPDVLERALARGAVPVSEERADRALARLHDRCARVRLVAARGRMGADLAEAHGFDTEVLPGGGAEVTTGADAISTRLYGAARVPDDRLRVQAVKSRGAPTDEDALDAVCAAIAASMDPRRIYLLGPGTTMRRVTRQLGLEKTILGVDAVRAGQLLASDLAERDLLELIADEPVTLVIGVVGGQGAILGRGNQQLSPAVLRRIGIENIEIVAGLRKLLALEPPLLRVDTGDPELDRALCGYRRVNVAPRRTLI